MKKITPRISIAGVTLLPIPFSFFPMSTCWYLTRCAALLCLPGIAAAQTTPAPAPADTARTYQRQLGLTASPVLDGFFRNNRSLPLGLLYKRQVKPGKALRLRLVGQYSRRDTANYPGSFPGTYFPGYRPDTYTQAVRVNAYAGYEWQHSLSRRWGWSHGVEVGAGWSRQIDHVVYDTNPYGTFINTNILINKITIWQGQVRPFLSLRYQVFNKVSVFVESAALLTYQSRKDEKDNSATSPFGYAYTYDKSHSFSFLWRPIQLIGTAIYF